MKTYENEKYLIVDTERNNLLCSIFIFFKETGRVEKLTKKDIEDNICWGCESEWQYETAKYYLDNKK